MHPLPVNLICVDSMISSTFFLKSSSASRSTKTGILFIEIINTNELRASINYKISEKIYFLLTLKTFPNFDPFRSISCKDLSAKNKSKLVHSFLFDS